MQVNFSGHDSKLLFVSPGASTRGRSSIGAARRLRERAATHFRRLKGHVSAHYSALRQPLLWTPKHVLLRDKLAFVLGVSHIITSAFWLGHSPSSFYRLYTVQALLLLTIRLALYRRDKMHYYFMDFCYYANALMFVQTWALPEYCALQKIMFSFATGPVAWSILMFRNSMIFHSLDKVCSNLGCKRWYGHVIDQPFWYRRSSCITFLLSVFSLRC
jgi:hypothetical protein